MRRFLAGAALTVVLAVPISGLSDAVVFAHHPLVTGEAICVDGTPQIRWTVTADAVRGYTWSVNGATAKPDSQPFTFTNGQTTFAATGDWWNQQGRHVAGPETRTGGPVALRTDCTPTTTSTTSPPDTTTSTSSAPATSTTAATSTVPATSTTPAPSTTGTPTTTEAPAPSTTDIGTPPTAPVASTAAVDVAPPATPAPPPSLGVTLPATGRSVRQPATAAIGLLALGVVLALGARRRTVKP